MAWSDLFPNDERRMNPALLSNEEVVFLAEHLGESPATALSGDVPEGVNRQTMDQVLRFFQDLESVGRWIGVERCLPHLERWMKRQAAVEKTRQESTRLSPRGAQFHPEMYSKVGRDYVWAGRGSDFQIVRSGEFDLYDNDGASPGIDAIAAEVAAISGTEGREEGFTDSGTAILCRVDGCEYTAQYDSESKIDRDKAIKKTLRHCKMVKKEKVDEHRAMAALITT